MEASGCGDLWVIVVHFWRWWLCVEFLIDNTDWPSPIISISYPTVVYWELMQVGTYWAYGASFAVDRRCSTMGNRRGICRWCGLLLQGDPVASRDICWFSFVGQWGYGSYRDLAGILPKLGGATWCLYVLFAPSDEELYLASQNVSVCNLIWAFLEGGFRTWIFWGVYCQFLVFPSCVGKVGGFRESSRMIDSEGPVPTFACQFNILPRTLLRKPLVWALFRDPLLYWIREASPFTRSLFGP